jgi:adenylosuccinate synthase
MYRDQELDMMPASLETYSQVNVLYETMPGWTEDISKIRTFDDLPINCKAYVLRLEQVNNQYFYLKYLNTEVIVKTVSSL